MLKEKHKETLSVLITEELGSDKPFCFTVGSLSMSPLIKPEDEITVRKSSFDTIKFGDIVVYEKQRDLYTHRLLGKRMSNSKIQFITKGDRALLIDEPVCEEELLGKVIGIKGKSKSINLESKSWKMVNGILGTLSYLQWIVFRFLRGCKRRISKLPGSSR